MAFTWWGFFIAVYLSVFGCIVVPILIYRAWNKRQEEGRFDAQLDSDEFFDETNPTPKPTKEKMIDREMRRLKKNLSLEQIDKLLIVGTSTKIKEREHIIPIKSPTRLQTSSSVSVRDKKHAYLQNFVLSTKFFQKEQQKVEYRFDHYSLRGRMDVIKWEVKSGETTIVLFEVKSKILDLQETIGRIHDYRTYLNMDVDPLFGKMPSKKLHTYLVLPEKEENRALLKEYYHMFKTSEIDYYMFVDTETDEYKILTKEQL